MWFYFRKRDLFWMLIKSIFVREKKKKYMSTKPTKVFTQSEVDAATKKQATGKHLNGKSMLNGASTHIN